MQLSFMRKTNALLTATLFGAVGCFCLVQPARAADDNVTQLHRLYDATRERQLREDPRLATDDGDKRYNKLWPDLSPAALLTKMQHEAADIETANTLTANLPPIEQLNREMFRRLLQNEIDRYRFAEQERLLDQLNYSGGVLTINETAGTIAFDAVSDYEEWIARLQGVGGVVDQTIHWLREGVKHKNVQPKIVMLRVREQLKAHLVTNADQSPFFQPFKTFPDAIGPADRGRLIGRARVAINESVVPAYHRLDAYLNKEYVPKCRDTVGIWDTPKGAEYYQNRVAWFTTTQLTAEQIHDIGVKEVERIRAEMSAIAAQTGFRGGLAEFFLKLRSDPRFKISDPEMLLRAYQAQAKRVDPLLPKLFGKLPRTPYGVRAIPAASAPDTTSAYYQPASPDGLRPGYFTVNLYKPEERPTYEIPALTLHESVPGHHLQIALAYELGDLPKFRREFDATAFVEGWALYAESLGDELGLYSDPYDKFGQLTFEMWRALRLVIDTGIHAKRWNREQAIALFKANTAKSDIEILNEVDRYIAWPGQALAYKLGQLKIRELRTRAERKLGVRFNVREFHDTVLANGAVPLDVLESNIDAWIEAQ
ncbi:MAG TPA: DUF885 domain-containing protein [Steroidobacteraceae bacterium]|nr:DUF885 domain-containing protein [Steroidobacteraceae bacterium]